LGSTGAHEVWVKQMNPHQGPTPLTEIPLAGKRLQATPSTLLSSLAYGVYNIYGVLELAGYTIAYIIPLLGRTEARLAVASLALAMIVLGAVVETVILLDVNSWWAVRAPYTYDTVVSLEE
jgi:hypothetical protein